MKSIKFTFLVTAVLLLSSCVSTPEPRTIGQGENDLGTGGGTPILFHSALYYPAEISLNFPGYIVGIEKSPKELISQDYDVKTVSIPAAGKKMDEHIQRIGGDDKLLYVSHILENFGDIHGMGNCAHHNAYYRTNQKNSPVDFCGFADKKQIDSKEAYSQSWEALEILREELRRKIEAGDYTHILVGVMGWNTAQDEAIRNFNSVGKNLRLAAPAESFRPLFIGVTWPSLWKTDWFQPIRTLFSYENKANDADEVGFGWLGVLLHDTLRDLPGDLPIVVLGHSFGARASSMGVCMGPAISKDEQFMPRNEIALLISLQGAYSINRFYPDRGKEGIYYPGGCENAKQIVLTASKHDKAMDNKKWVPFVGNNTTFNKYCKEESYPGFDCVKVKEEGEVSLPANSQKHKSYINANDLITYNAYGSGGLAHSDIYRKEMGVMLWKVIAAKTPAHR